MSRYILKKNHSGAVKKRITVKAKREKVWKKISNIVGLPEWIDDIKKATYLSKSRRGIGAIRKLTFSDGNIIEEHIVGWKNGESVSYVAVSGLPLRVYHATLSIQNRNKNSVFLTWSSYMNSKKMTKKEFNEFHSFMGEFYQNSLKKIKEILEK